MAEKTHKSLQSTFAGPVQRGNKLQGLLKSAAPQGLHQNPASGESGAAHPLDDPAPHPTTNQTPTSTASSGGETLAAPAQPSPSAAQTAAAGQPAQSETGATSVYLRPKAYRELVDRRQKKFRSYAQTVYDAFAFIRDQATDQQKNPADALAELFDIGDAADPWLMPEPRSARNAAEPTVEARIAFKPHERQWVKQRMAESGATHLSPFLATVLEHYLLRAKN